MPSLSEWKSRRIRVSKFSSMSVKGVILSRTCHLTRDWNHLGMQLLSRMFVSNLSSMTMFPRTALFAETGRTFFFCSVSLRTRSRLVTNCFILLISICSRCSHSCRALSLQSEKKKAFICSQENRDHLNIYFSRSSSISRCRWRCFFWTSHAWYKGSCSSCTVCKRILSSRSLAWCWREICRRSFLISDR